MKSQSSKRPVHSKRAPRRALKVVGLSLVGVLTFLATVAAAAYYSIQSNIEPIEVDNLLAPEAERPSVPDPEDATAGSALNILLVGSDDRGGENASIGGQGEGMRSDTTIVLHISADRTRVEMISIPRDSLVELPACVTTGGREIPAKSNSMFNQAFSRGWDQGGDIESAAACTMNTVESLTDVRMDGFMVVDFAGFENIVSAIGGVPICLEEPMVSPKADLNLAAGEHVLDGPTALAFNRARYGVGDGSDTQRIDRQQEFMEATFQAILQKDVLSNPKALFDLAQATTSSLSATPEFSSIKNLTGLAFSLREIKTDAIYTTTVPFTQAPTDKNRVVWTDEADVLWEKVRNDQPLNPELNLPAPPEAPAPVEQVAAPEVAVPTEIVTLEEPVAVEETASICG